MAHEHEQQAVLGRREGEGFVSQPDFAGGEIHGQITGPEIWRCACARIADALWHGGRITGATEERAQAREEFEVIEGLGQVIVGPEVERAPCRASRRAR